MNPFVMLSFIVSAIVATADSTFDIGIIIKQHHEAMRAILSTLQMRSPQAEISTFALSSQQLQDCVNYINKKQFDDLMNYQKNVEACMEEASDSKKILSRQTNDKRKDLLQRGNNSCALLTDCDRNADGLQFFTCYSQAADKSSQNLRNMSLTSNDEVSSLNMHYQKIDFDEGNCETSAGNSYEAAVINTSREMQSCLLGDFVPPTEIPTTPGPSTETSTVATSSSSSIGSTSTSTVISIDPTAATSNITTPATESSSVVSTNSTTAAPDSFHGSEARAEEALGDPDLPMIHMSSWDIIRRMLRN